MKIKNRKIGPRTMVTADGEPVMVGLMMRPSSSAPSRIKAVLVIATSDQHGEPHGVPLPFAQATMAPGGKTPRGFTPEFRLEMN